MINRRGFLRGAACLAAGASGQAHGAEAHAAGLYLFIIHPDLPHLAAEYSEALAKPFIDGAAIILQWSEIEPKSEVYDWSTLDLWLGKILALGKKFSVGLTAGLYTPDWIYRPPYNVAKNDFNYNRSSVGQACTIMSQPSAWEPAFAAAYGKTLTALAQHIRDRGAAHALTMVKLSGINNTTEELRVDVTAPDDGPCRQSDATAIWAQAGFTPEKLETAFSALAGATERAFPDKALVMEIIHKGAFPAIDANGRVGHPGVPDALTLRLIDLGLRKFRAKLIVQWDALWQGPPPREVLDAGARGARIGWQMNGFRGQRGGSGCIYPGFAIQDCRSAADFRAILDNGFALGGSYIEVQVASVNDPRWLEAFKAARSGLPIRAVVQ